MLASPLLSIRMRSKRSHVPVKDEHVVGNDVPKSMENATLREVNLLLVAGRECRIECADQLDGAPADEYTMTHARGNIRSQANRHSPDLRRKAAGRHPVRQPWDRPISVRNGKDRSCVGEGCCRGDTRLTKRRR